jgi:hypothetical protein
LSRTHAARSNNRRRFKIQIVKYISKCQRRITYIMNTHEGINIEIGVIKIVHTWDRTNVPRSHTFQQSHHQS